MSAPLLGDVGILRLLSRIPCPALPSLLWYPSEQSGAMILPILQNETSYVAGHVLLCDSQYYLGRRGSYDGSGRDHCIRHTKANENFMMAQRPDPMKVKPDDAIDRKEL